MKAQTKTQGKIENFRNKIVYSITQFGNLLASSEPIRSLEDKQAYRTATRELLEKIEKIHQAEQNVLLDRVIESFDIELKAWMEAHSKQDRSFDTQSLVKHMKKYLKEVYKNEI